MCVLIPKLQIGLESHGMQLADVVFHLQLPIIDHRIIEGFGLEGTLKPIQFQPLPWAGCSSPGQAAQSPIPPGPERLQEHPQLWAALPGPHRPLGKEFLPNSNLKFPSDSSKSFPLVLSLLDQDQDLKAQHSTTESGFLPSACAGSGCQGGNTPYNSTGLLQSTAVRGDAGRVSSGSNLQPSHTSAENSRR